VSMLPFFIIESGVWVTRISRLHLCNQIGVENDLD